jgi:hypothetical protein
MRYLKNYKLYESVNDIFKKLPIEEAEISDILIDLKDNGYDIKYQSFFLSESGKTYEDNKGIGNYYPAILISIERKKNSVGGDARNWDGSIYFEDSDSVLDSIYHSISRLKNTLKDYKVYYTIRNINEIYIRIVFDKETQDDFSYEFAISEYRKLIEKYSNIDGLNGRYDETNFTTFYEFEEHLSTKSKITMEISPITTNSYNVDIFNPTNILSLIVKRSVVFGDLSNKNDLMSMFNTFLNEYVEKLNSKYSVKSQCEGYGIFRIVNKTNKDTYITFNIDYEINTTHKVLTKEGGFMRRDKYENISLFKLNVDTEFKQYLRNKRIEEDE